LKSTRLQPLIFWLFLVIGGAAGCGSNGQPSGKGTGGAGAAGTHGGTGAGGGGAGAAGSHGGGGAGGGGAGGGAAGAGGAGGGAAGAGGAGGGAGAAGTQGGAGPEGGAGGAGGGTAGTQGGAGPDGGGAGGTTDGGNGDGSTADVAPNLDLSGKWYMVCCNAIYSSNVTFIQTGTTLGGMFTDSNNDPVGTIVGTVNGFDVMFTRTWDTYSQVYMLTLSPDGKTLTGTFTGTHDPSVDYYDVTMTRL
jgi:hypothetical protein